MEKEEYKNKDTKTSPMPVYVIRREGVKNREKRQRNKSLWLG